MTTACIYIQDPDARLPQGPSVGRPPATRSAGIGRRLIGPCLNLMAVRGLAAPPATWCTCLRVPDRDIDACSGQTVRGHSQDRQGNTPTNYSASGNDWATAVRNIFGSSEIRYCKLTVSKVIELCVSFWHAKELYPYRFIHSIAST